ncbi:MAG: hypothetical protein AB8C46_06420 [Burkholderiaceae bacterium]
MSLASRTAQIALLANLLSIQGCATLLNEQNQSDLRATHGSEWMIIASDEEVVVAQRSIIGGVVSVKCEFEGCRTLIVTDTECEPYSTIPVLINTAIESGVAHAQCFPYDAPAEDDIDAQWPASLIVLTEPNVLLPHMILGDDVSLAVPMTDGSIRVFLVMMTDLRALIAPLRPDLFESPGWLNEHELDPLPDENTMDNDELIQWRRGLLGI